MKRIDNQLLELARGTDEILPAEGLKLKIWRA
jgi:hypothetical protein